MTCHKSKLRIRLDLTHTTICNIWLQIFLWMHTTTLHFHKRLEHCANHLHHRILHMCTLKINCCLLPRLGYCGITYKPYLTLHQSFNTWHIFTHYNVLSFHATCFQNSPFLERIKHCFHAVNNSNDFKMESHYQQKHLLVEHKTKFLNPFNSLKMFFHPFLRTFWLQTTVILNI